MQWEIDKYGLEQATILYGNEGRGTYKIDKNDPVKGYIISATVNSTPYRFIVGNLFKDEPVSVMGTITGTKKLICGFNWTDVISDLEFVPSPTFEDEDTDEYGQFTAELEQLSDDLIKTYQNHLLRPFLGDDTEELGDITRI